MLNKLCENLIDMMNYEETNSLKLSIIKKYDLEKWTKTIEYLYHNYRYHKGIWRFGITKNAVKLSEKIEKEIGNTLFPMVVPTMVSYAYKSDGYCVWNMYDENMDTWGSCNKVSDCNKKKYKLSVLEDSLEIIADIR